jgi:RNA polymerase sigma-70 factor (ECF subfamily)
MDRHTPRISAVESRVPSVEEARLVEALCTGDEEVFVGLVRLYGPAMLRVAQLYGVSRAVAEEVVQQTWLAVLTGIVGFEGRSSFKTWLFRILRNTAQTQAVREGRSVPFSALSDQELAVAEDPVEADRFRRAGERFADHWRSSPDGWAQLPETNLLARETISVVERAVASLRPVQRAVITLRDIEGWDAGEVADFLEISDTNERVLLHRARAKVRKALERHFASS